MQINRRQVLFLFTGSLLASSASLIGCGGGSGKGNINDTTRQQVSSIHQLSLGARSILDPMLRRNGNFGGMGYVTPMGGGTTGSGGGGNATPPMPTDINSTTPVNEMGQNLLMPAAGFRGILEGAKSSSPSRKYRPTRGKAVTRQTSSGGDGSGSDIWIGEPGPWSGFYYDYYLELWVEMVTSATEFRINYYIDEAKTQPAGYSLSKQPADWTVFPQTSTYDYQFTAGTLKGSHGKSDTTIKADYAGDTSYENVYADGWKDTGKSTWFPNGASTWISRTDMADGQWIESTGSFRPDGTGNTRTKLSSGYEANYTYNADGSGSGKITGPDPLLPVTMTWNYCGDTKIVYANGTVEEIQGWCGNYYPYVGSVTVGGTTGSSGSDTPPPPSTPAPK
jgi:hypothetical protein